MSEVRRLRPLLGTYVEIGARGAPAVLDEAVSAAFAAIQEVHDLASFQSPASPLSQLNRQPGTPLLLPRPLVAVLRLARLMTARSGRLFNCTVGGALVQAGVLPDHGGPAALPCGDEHDLVIHGCAVCLRRPVRITLDGIAKGFAVDRAVRIMRARGVTAGWINAGGDLRAFGELSLPVQRREPDGRMLPLGWLRDAAVATSVRQRRPDPRFPGWLVADGDTAGAEHEARAWTVLARQAWRADALTKVAALAPAATRQRLLESLGGHLLEPAAP